MDARPVGLAPPPQPLPDWEGDPNANLVKLGMVLGGFAQRLHRRPRSRAVRTGSATTVPSFHETTVSVTVKRSSRVSGVEASSSRTALNAGTAARTICTSVPSEMTRETAKRTENSAPIIAQTFHPRPVEGLVENLWSGYEEFLFRSNGACVPDVFYCVKREM